MSQSYIRVKEGSYRNQDVSGKVFALVKQFQIGTKGGFITVCGEPVTGKLDSIRVKVPAMSSYEFVSESEYDGVPVMASAESVSSETDEQVMDRIRERFAILDEMTRAAVEGNIRAMIVTGPPGVGKSFGVEREIEKATLFDRMQNKKVRAEVVKGSTTAVGLYCTLYKYSDPNSVLVFDDCDTVLLDDVSLNLLKGALDTGRSRKISWLSDSRVLRSEGVPETFNFKGSVIFITNLKMDNLKSQKLKDHLEALQSRCHYLDLNMDSMRERILRIRQIAQDGELFSNYDFSQEQQNAIIQFMDDNKNKLREVSLRMAIKIADLVKSFPLKWQAMAAVTCMKQA